MMPFDLAMLITLTCLPLSNGSGFGYQKFVDCKKRLDYCLKYKGHYDNERIHFCLFEFKPEKEIH